MSNLFGRTKKVLLSLVSVLAVLAVVVVPKTQAAVLERGTSGGFGLGGSDLGELIVLSELFDDDDDNNENNENEQMPEPQVPEGQTSPTASGADDDDDDDDTDLSELLVLEGLFGTGGGGDVITVQSGDTLSAIARDFLGDASRFSEIAELNNIPNPNLIFTGEQLALPRDGVGGGSDLGRLIVLDKFFDDDDNDDDDGTDLEELIILESLFN